MKKGQTHKRTGESILFLAAAVLTVFFCFWRLGADKILGFDEGRHAVNALEMYRSGEWIVSTYNGEADYFNLKPPLSMYLIMAGFRLFGVNNLGIRFFSALCYLLMAVLAAVFVARRKGWSAGAFTLLLFGSSRVLLLNSMARKGEANAVYNLCFLVAMLSLMRLLERKASGRENGAERKRRPDGKMTRGGEGLPECLGIGLGCSLAFLSKSFHAAVAVLVVGLTLCIAAFLQSRRQTETVKQNKTAEPDGAGRGLLGVAEWFTLVLSGIGPVAFWAVLRYRVDGLSFLKEMFLTDVWKRSNEVIAGTAGGPFHYVGCLMRENTTLLTLFLLGMLVVFRLYTGEERKEKAGRTESTGRFSRLLSGSGREIVLFLWVILPLVLFAFPKTKMITYVYPSFTGLYVCAGFILPKLWHQKKDNIMRFVCGAWLCFAAVLLVTNIGNLVKTISAEEPDAFERFVEKEGALFAGNGNVYHTAQNAHMGNVWYQDELLTMEIATTLHCKDGGIEAYRKDPGECYLIVNIGWSFQSAEEVKEGADGRTVYRDEEFWVLKKEGNGYVLKK